MKHTRKIASLLLALVMVFSLAMTASAAENYTITAPANGHTYEIYQIFTGDLSDGVLSNVVWGENGTGTTGDAVDEDTLAALEAVKDSTSNTEKLDVILDYVDLETEPVETLTDGGEASVPAGYYLIKDKDGSVEGSDVYTTYIVEVVGDITISPKVSVPESEKKVKDTNDSTGETSDWQDSADHDVGDEVSFQLSGTVASNYDDYKTYYFAFHDKESEGLTFNPDSVKVYVDGVEITEGFEVVVGAEDGCTFEVIFENLKDIEIVKAGSEITVEYTSTLNENAVVGSEGNTNTMHLEFSNNPNEEQDGEPDTGNTPDDTVIVFTYETIVNKVDEEGKPLTGAEFTLEKYNKETDSWEAIAVVKSEDGTTFTFSGLDDGNYRLVETKTPDGYNTVEDIYFTIEATHDDELTELVVKDAEGNVISGVDMTFSTDVDAGSVETDVENKKGTTLPETGGIGTTIFYAVGGVLVLAAVILLVTKKRMSTAE